MVSHVMFTLPSQLKLPLTHAGSQPLLNLLEDQSHRALIQGAPPSTPAWGLEGGGRKATGTPGGNADTFKAVKDIRGTLMAIVSLGGRCHDHQHPCRHRRGSGRPQKQGVAAPGFRSKPTVMTGVLLSMHSRPQTVRASESQGAGWGAEWGGGRF